MNRAQEGQLVLNLGQRLDARLSDFAGQGWAQVVDAIDGLLTGRLTGCLVYGAAYTGKTRLLAAACDTCSRQGHPALLVSFCDLIASNPPESLQNLENYRLLALDDLDALRGLPEWQEALFHLWNRMQLQGTAILLSARAAPRDLGLQLPDLLSRINQAACYRVPDGSSLEDREAVLRAALGRRDLNLDPEIVRYLLQRGPAQTGLLLQHLETLDEASLQYRKRLTLAFVRQMTENLPVPPAATPRKS